MTADNELDQLAEALDDELAHLLLIPGRCLDCYWYPENFWGSWRDVPERCERCGRQL